MRSLQVARSSTLLLSVRNVDWISVLRQSPPCPEFGETAGKSSPESSKEENRECHKSTQTQFSERVCFWVLCKLSLWSPLHCPLVRVPLTRFCLHLDSLRLCKFQSSDPSLALYFGAGLQVIGLCPSIRNHKIARIFHSNVGCGQVNGASACVTHLSLSPEDRDDNSSQICSLQITYIYRCVLLRWLCGVIVVLLLSCKKAFITRHTYNKILMHRSSLSYTFAISF